MREILFRGKAKNSNRWVYGDLLSPQHNENYYSIFEIGGGCVKVKAETIGQYVGIKDKNGKKIFEGDVVRGDNFVKQEKTYATAVTEVIFRESMGMFVFKEFHSQVNGINYSSCNLSFNYLSNIEVIGNIYDNPKIMEDYQ